MAEITEIKLLDNLVGLHVGNSWIDLHNDYSCISFFLENDVLEFEFSLDEGVKDGDNSVNLLFKDCEIKRISYPTRSEGPLTLDSFYRGKFEHEGLLFERDEKGRMYFYIEFTDFQKFEFFSSGVYVESYKATIKDLDS